MELLRPVSGHFWLQLFPFPLQGVLVYRFLPSCLPQSGSGTHSGPGVGSFPVGYFFIKW